MQEQCPALASYIAPTVTGGKGGATPDAGTPEVPPPAPGSSSRQLAGFSKLKQELREAEIHELRKAEFLSKAEARSSSAGDAETGRLQKVLEYIELAKKFTTAGEQEMAEHCTAQASVLKLNILVVASTLQNAGGGNTPVTPLSLVISPRVLLSPLTPV
jgi:hypothetical protein